MTEVVPCHLVEYTNQSEVEVEYDSAGDPVVINHDTLEKENVVYGLSRESAEQYNLDITTSDQPMWDDRFTDIELGEVYKI